MSYIERPSDTDFDNWLASPDRRPLVLRGARQVGKSTLVRTAAKRANRKLVEFNLETSPDLEKIFATLDVEKIIKELSFRAKTALDKNVILFLDEAQACPSSLNALRYFWEKNPEIAVVSAGSLLEFAIQKENFSMPVGRVDFQFVRPFCFREFLKARKRSELLQVIEDFVFNRTPDIPQAAHNALLTELSQFVFVGGMPESLARFVDEKTTASGIKQSRAVQNRILLAYRDDFGKYAKRIPVDALRAIVDAMPAIVGASKVKFSAISREYKAEQLRSAMTALEQAGLLHRVFHSPANAIPLAAGEDSAYFKLLPLDIGLWVSQTFGNMIAPEFSDNFFQKWLSENPFEKRWVGQIAEIVVGNSILSQHQIPGRVHYWIREAKSSNAEVDYIVQHGLHVIPVEIKAGNSGSLKSLHLFMQEKGVSHAVRFDTNTPSLQLVQCRASTAGGNVADVSYTLHNLPLYVADWLFEYVAHRLPSN